MKTVRTRAVQTKGVFGTVVMDVIGAQTLWGKKEIT